MTELRVSANGEPVPDHEIAHRLYTVSVRDAVNTELAEHEGRAYVSPPQPREQALALVALLLGSAASPAAPRDTWTRAIAGGQRTITLQTADPPTNRPVCDDRVRTLT